MWSFEEKIKLARTNIGWLELKGWSLIRVQGEDRELFLQALITNDILNNPPNTLFKGALLEKNSKIKFDFWVFKSPDQLHLLVAKEFVDKLIANLNQFIFAEEVSFHKLNCSPIYLQGPKLPELYNYLKLPSYKKNHIIKTLDYLIVNLSLTGDEGALFLALKEDLPNKQTTKEKSTLDIIIDKDKSLLAILDEKKVIKIDEKIFNLFRIEAGVPILGLDYDYDNMLLEVDSQDEMLDVNKGCYPGQETIARTLSRGSVQKKIFGLKHQDNELKLGDTLYFRGKSIAEIKSTIYSLNFNSYLSLAFIHRDYWFHGKEFRFEKIPNDFKSRKSYTVQQLPFYFGSNLLHSAQKELDQGMKAFHQNNHHQAKIHLNQALTIHPRFPDAVEALAVIEERLDNIDKAIEHNKQFAKLDPNAIMARTNLSRLYMKKGWIEKAEEEQKKATLLGYKYGNENREDIQAELKKKASIAIEKKLAVFKEVLKIDPLDEIANFGLGKIYYDQQQYLDSIKCLKIVIKQNKDYSVAYDILSRSLISLKLNAEAREYLKKGIEVAAKQGDLTPKQSMEEQLRKIS